MRWALAAGVLGVLSMAAGEPFPPCVAGTTCIQITPYKDKNLTFDCATTTPFGHPSGNVILLHGNDGPRSKGMWALTQQALTEEGFKTLACDQRGYSAGASPNDVLQYSYDLLATDIFAVADSYFGNGVKFHIVGHDQGARVAWYSLTAAHTGRQRYLSFTTLSIAHLDAFSDMIYGPNIVPKQQLNFQYQRTLAMNDSVTAYNSGVWHKVCQQAYEYSSQQACQAALWWYNGALRAGAYALQPFTGQFGPVGESFHIPASYIEAHTLYPLEGLPQRNKIGYVKEVPVQYICGAGETADLCDDEARDRTAALVANFTYMRLNTCSHNLTSPAACPEFQKVIDAVVNFAESW